MEDAEHPDHLAILEMLERAKPMADAVLHAVRVEQQRYRAEALAAASLGEDRFEKEILVCLARGRLRRRLEALLGK